MSDHETELGETLVKRIQSYEANPCDVANVLVKKLQEFSATPEGSSFCQEHLLFLIESYAVDPSSFKVNEGMCCAPLEDKKKLLDTIKDRAIELKKALRAGKTEEVREGLKQLGRQVIEVPLHPTHQPGVFRKDDFGYIYLLQAADKWFGEQKTILKETLGIALSKHLDLMEECKVPNDVVRMILFKICN